MIAIAIGATQAPMAVQTFSLQGLKWRPRQCSQLGAPPTTAGPLPRARSAMLCVAGWDTRADPPKWAVAPSRHWTPFVTIRAGINATFRSELCQATHGCLYGKPQLQPFGGRSVSVRAMLLRWDRSPYYSAPSRSMYCTLCRACKEASKNHQ